MRHHLRPPQEEPKHVRLSPLALVLIGCAAFWFIAVLLVSEARSHTSPTGQEYPSWCCNGNTNTGDCQAIPAKSVKAMSGGYGVTLVPGDHRRVTKPQSYAIPQDKVRPSTDGQYHLCLYPKEENARCFFAPPPGS